MKNRTSSFSGWVVMKSLIAVACLGLAAAACRDDEPSSKAGSQKSSGGESALDRAGRNIDEAHRDFQEDVRPVANEVDEKTNEAVREGKTAVRKTTDAVAGED